MVLAALQNAAKVVAKVLSEMTVAVVGMGAAGVACAKLLHLAGVADIIGVDRAGILHEGRARWCPQSSGSWTTATGAVERVALPRR